MLKNKQNDIDNIFNAILIFLIGITPLNLMLSKKGPSAIYYAICAVSLLILYRQKWMGYFDTIRSYKWLVIALSAPTVSILFSAAWNSYLPGQDIEYSLRFLTAGLLFIPALIHIEKTWTKNVIWGYLIGALGASVFIVTLSSKINWGRPNTGAVYNAVGYGNLTLLLSTISLFSLKIKISSWHKTEQAVKIAIASFAFFAFVLTQTRTAWLAVPFFAIIATGLFTNKAKPRKIIILSSLLIAALSIFFVSNDNLRQRATTAYHEVTECQNVNSLKESSLCIRIQLWRASLDMLSERPIAGNGDTRQFIKKLQNESLPKGLVTPYVAQGWGEPHNDIMLALSSFGLPGGIALILAYLVPAIIFFNRMAFNNPAHIRSAAAMGLALCIGFIIFGIGETMLRGMRTVAFYSISVSIFMYLSNKNNLN